MRKYYEWHSDCGEWAEAAEIIGMSEHAIQILRIVDDAVRIADDMEDYPSIEVTYAAFVAVLQEIESNPACDALNYVSRTPDEVLELYKCNNAFKLRVITTAAHA